MTVKTLRPSIRASVIGAIDPDAYGTGTYTTGWIDASRFGWFLAAVMTGTLGTSATVDAKIEVSYGADDSARNTNAEDLTGYAITQLVKATNDDDQALVNVPATAVGAFSTATEEQGTFTHLRLSVTVGTATSDAGAIVLGFDPSYSDGDEHAATVVEVV